MKLIAFGESFTAGQTSEHPNQRFDKSTIVLDSEYHQYSYVTHIFDEMKDTFSDLINNAGCGWSNDKIWFSIREYVQNNCIDDIMVIVGWTSPTRDNFYYNYKNNDYERIPKECRVSMHELYKYGILNYASMVFHYETMILATHEYLKSLNVKHMMIQTFHDHKQHLIKELEIVNPIIPFEAEMNYWPNWSKRNNTLFDIVRYEYCNEHAPSLGASNHDTGDFRNYIHMDTISSCLHPSPKGYKLIAHTLMPYVRKIIKDNYWKNN